MHVATQEVDMLEASSTMKLCAAFAAARLLPVSFVFADIDWPEYNMGKYSCEGPKKQL